MRINKYIANTGFTSRRKADDLIKEGRVKVNDNLITEPGFKVEDTDKVTIDGQLLELEKKFYIKLYKPVGYITSNFDPYNKLDLNDLLKIDKRFYAAGRLDKDSEGLLIITNDGEFTNNIIHPKFKLDKEYIVDADKTLSKKEENLFMQGLDIGNGEHTSDAYIKLIGNKKYQVIIHQGYNRQIRRMFEYFNSSVKRLKRIRIGDISLSSLKEKDYKYFDKEEMLFVKKVKR
ncbi:pseudouridine synthase [uncultured Anaerococcus sp.]|uniref:pseudouridine synthase n=1 Tax=uncultured Anaerococcus sp. TaxID=293428 RepID=UPI00288AFF95|nr:pseudouridine synthase [uncultured Anaerococcus sp.]